MRRIGIFFIVFLLFAGSCSDDAAVVLLPEDFFPLKTGFYQVYDVEEVIYSAFSPPELTRYELKSEIVDSFVNTEGGNTYVIHRSIRDNAGSPWMYTETWSARTNDQFVIVSEGTTSFVKLRLPLRVKTRWNGNLFNTLGEDEYILSRYENNYQTESNSMFPKSIVIDQNNESNLVNRDLRVEVYSALRGLVFKESQVWNYKCAGGNCTGEIQDGYYWKQTLKEHGEK